MRPVNTTEGTNEGDGIFIKKGPQYLLEKQEPVGLGARSVADLALLTNSDWVM